MQINRIELENFRGFPQFELDLHPEFTLLLGRNGAGKTAVLESLAIALGEWFTALRQVSGQKRYLQRDDVRRVMSEAAGQPTLEEAYPVKVKAVAEVGGVATEWTRHILERSSRARSSGAQVVRERAAELETAVVAGKDVDLPVLAFYGTARLWLQKRDREDAAGRIASRLHGYDACLEPASSTWQFEAWMRWREEARVQRLAKALESGQPGTDVRELQLEAVQQAAVSCLPGATTLQFSLNHRMLMVGLSDGRILPFHLLSDGYRNLIALAADLAWRAAQLNPHHGAEAATKASGVVLIDEIDLHLHPHWQRRVISDLRRTFPKIQFVATTHSPQVLSTAESDWVRLLTPGGSTALRVGHVRGRDTNALLEDVFGEPARPAPEQEQLEFLAKLIDAGSLKEARDLLARMEALLGSEDRDVVRATWELRDRELETNAADLERT